MKIYEVLVDNDGKTYYQIAKELEWQYRDFSDDYISNTVDCNKAIFHKFDENYYEHWHAVEKPKMVLYYFGKTEVTLGDGTKLIVQNGDVIIYHDDHGQGHQTKGLEPGMSIVLTLF